MFVQNKIYRDENYIIVEVTGEIDPREYAIGNTAYTFKGDNFLIIEAGSGAKANGETSMPEANVVAGDWEDDGAVAYDVTTLTAFLRLNTGFNPAAGGSAAYSEKFETTLNDAQIKTLGSFGPQLMGALVGDNIVDYKLTLKFKRNGSPNGYDLTNLGGIIIKQNLSYTSAAGSDILARINEALIAERDGEEGHVVVVGNVAAGAAGYEYINPMRNGAALSLTTENGLEPKSNGVTTNCTLYVLFEYNIIPA